LEFTVRLNESLGGIQFPVNTNGCLRLSAIPKEFVGLIVEEFVVPFIRKLFLNDRHEGSMI
jgi:hypothetical protein